MTYEKYEKRVAAIDRWFDEYIKETFVSANQFGHLKAYHINRNDEFLKGRSRRLKCDISTFVGEESDIVAMLISCIMKNRQELIEYLADIDDYDVWEVTGQLQAPVAGKSYHYSISHHWENGALPCKNFKISFKKNEYNPNAIVITSAYPY
nr:hypothetical protein [uncultured Blautia sp.]